jgi:hypothetical protein
MGGIDSGQQGNFVRRRFTEDCGFIEARCWKIMTASGALILWQDADANLQRQRGLCEGETDRRLSGI